MVGPVYFSVTSDPADIAAQLKAKPAGQRVLLNRRPRQCQERRAVGVGQPGRPADWGSGARGSPVGTAAEAAWGNKFYAASGGRRSDRRLLGPGHECQITTWTLTPPQLAAMVADPRWSALGISPAVSIGYLDASSRAFALAMQVTLGDVPARRVLRSAGCHVPGGALL